MVPALTSAACLLQLLDSLVVRVAQGNRIVANEVKVNSDSIMQQLKTLFRAANGGIIYSSRV